MAVEIMIKCKFNSNCSYDGFRYLLSTECKDFKKFTQQHNAKISQFNSSQDCYNTSLAKISDAFNKAIKSQKYAHLVGKQACERLIKDGIPKIQSRNTNLWMHPQKKTDSPKPPPPPVSPNTNPEDQQYLPETPAKPTIRENPLRYFPPTT